MNGIQVYQRVEADTASTGNVVLMLYRGALRNVLRGIFALEAGKPNAAHVSLVQAQEWVEQLLLALDRERGGDIAERLAALYAYMLRRLSEANVRKDAEPAREVERHLRELLSAWETIVQQTPAAAPGWCPVAA